jgi:hypothetical protein
MPNLNFISNLKELLKNRGVHGGIGYTGNTLKMAGYLLAPLLIPWFLVNMFVPKPQSDLFVGIIFSGWLCFAVIFYFYLKAAASEYVVFPQAHWRFPDGQQISFDNLITPKSGEQKGWELKAEYKDGSTFYRVTFRDKMMYQDPDRPYPDIFDYALWKLPASWNDSFSRNGVGEFFFGGLFVTNSTCENIDVSVVDWDERGSTRIPVCVITACSYYYKKVLEKQGRKLPDTDAKKVELAEAKNQDLKSALAKTEKRNIYLEQEAEQYGKEEPEDIKDMSDKRIAGFLKRHTTIMNAGKQGKWTKILNLKTLAWAVAIIAGSLLLLHLLGIL